MLSESQNEFLRGLYAEHRGLATRNRGRSLAQHARLEKRLASWRAGRRALAVAGCGE